ncbi:MAG: hypothetical protein JWN56_249 [Sphingobacteriales bacterium]|nr:hypothetical protein [Sphingobacteriales bacterium]
MAFDDRKSKSFDIVVDMVKLLITLCTAIIGFLLSSILIAEPDDEKLIIIKANSFKVQGALLVLGVSVFFGILTILKITGILGDEKILVENTTIYDKFTRFSFSICLLLFFIGILLLTIVSLNAI